METKNRAIITVVGKDTVGIIAKVCNYLASNNININDKNVAISGLANGIDTFYLNVNSLYTNDNGPLLPQYTADGLHLDGSRVYKSLCDFLREHALPDEHFERLEQTW